MKNYLFLYLVRRNRLNVNHFIVITKVVSSSIKLKIKYHKKSKKDLFLNK